MKTRTLVAIPLLLLLYALIALPPMWRLFLISFAAASCADELSRAFVKRDWLNSITTGVAAGVPWIPFPWLTLPENTHWVLLAYALTVLVASIAMYRKRKTPVPPAKDILLFCLLPALLISMALGLLNLRISWQTVWSSYTILQWRTMLMPFLIAVGTDTCAYLVGRTVGKHKMAPVVSPNKTWEGAAGGLLGGVLFLLIYALIPVDGRSLVSLLGLPWILSCGLLGAIAAQAGDLCFSALKRKAGIKDFGNLLPGHGGVLDRLDSLLFVIPTVAFWGLVWFQWA